MLGTVIHYDTKGKFGFIAIPGHERTVFFHNSRQRSFYCGLNAQIWDDGDWKDEPKIGDKVIVYAIELVDKGPRATYWAKAETKTQAEEVLALLPVYRLQHRGGREAVSRLDPKPLIRTIWEGKDLVDLADKSQHFQIEFDEFNYYYFEIEHKEEVDGVITSTWERCSNPT